MKIFGYIIFVLGCFSFIQQAFFLHHAVIGATCIIATGLGLIYFGKQKNK